MRVSLSPVTELTVVRVGVWTVAGLVLRLRSVSVRVTAFPGPIGVVEVSVPEKPACTVALAVLVLTAAVWALAIEATFEIRAPPATASPRVASKVRVVVAPPPLSAPTLHARFGAPAALAPVPVIEPTTYVVLAGTVSATVTPVAFMLPLLRTTIV